MQLCSSLGYAAEVHHCFEDLQSIEIDCSQKGNRHSLKFIFREDDVNRNFHHAEKEQMAVNPLKGSALGAAAALVPAATLVASTKNETTDSPRKAASSANQGQYITVGKENGYNYDSFRLTC